MCKLCLGPDDARHGYVKLAIIIGGWQLCSLIKLQTYIASKGDTKRGAWRPTPKLTKSCQS